MIAENYMVSYTEFVAEEALHENLLFDYLSEAKALTLGDVNLLKGINEGFIDTVKGVIKKVADFIKRMWNKFIERAAELLSSDVKWLEKYKDVILKNPVKSHDITDFYDYNVTRLLNDYKVPLFTDNQFKNICKAENTESAFISEYYKDLKPDSDLKEQIEEKLKGNERDIDMNTLSMKSLYDYCHDYKSTLQALQKNKDDILSIQAKIEKVVADQLKNMPKKEEETEDDSETQNNDAKEVQNMIDSSVVDKTKPITTAANMVQNKGLSSQNQSATIYSSIYGGFINESVISSKRYSIISEMEVEKKGTDSNTSASDSNVEKNKAMANNKTSIGDTSEDEIKKIQNNSSKYFTCCGNILAAKLTVAASMYKDYMKILRVHVRDYVGNKEDQSKNK